MAPPSPDWRRIAGEGTLLHSYLEMMRGQETPLIYDFMCGLWALGALCGRSVIIARPRAPVFLNSYLILCAESGITRKSTSVSIATKLVREVAKMQKLKIAFYETKATASAILSHMTDLTNAKQPCWLVISISELASALGRGGGVSGVPALLTDLYDCPKERSGAGTITDGWYNVRDVYINFLSASTPSWLARAVDPSVVEGGFTSRCLFIHAEKRKALIPWPSIDENSISFDTTVNLYANTLKGMGIRSIQLTNAALAIFSNWYKTRRIYDDPFRASFASREDAHILRVAGLLSISGKKEYITEDAIRNAIAIVVHLREMGGSLFTSGNKLHQEPPRLISGIDKLRKVLLNAGTVGISQANIYGNCKRLLTGAQISDILAIMHELQMVQRFEMQSIGRPTTIWRGTKRLLASTFNELLLARLNEPPPSEGVTGPILLNGNEEGSN